MRLLLSIILLSVFFFTPFNSKAGAVNNNRTAKLNSNHTSKKAIALYLISDDHVAVISNAEQRNNSVTRYRPFSHTDFFITDCLIKKTIPFPETKYFAPPHLYCKKIGSRLLFPKHYFW